MSSSDLLAPFDSATTGVRTVARRFADTAPPESFFAVSAIFHYLGPSFAVLLFARVEVLGVAWLRIGSAAVIFALWRRPWRCLLNADRALLTLLVSWGVVLAGMNSCFYLAIARLPLSTVAAIEFLPVIAIAALGSRTRRNLLAVLLAVTGVYLLTDVKLTNEPLGFVFAFANAGLFAVYIVIGARAAERGAGPGLDNLGASMLIAAVVATPIGGYFAAPAFRDPIDILAGIGVGLCSSVIPYVTDQLALARLNRSTYAMLVSLFPAIATVIGIVVLGQLPTTAEIAGMLLVGAGVAIHFDRERVPEA
jgi:inner membrane transporter RhtA